MELLGHTANLFFLSPLFALSCAGALAFLPVLGCGRGAFAYVAGVGSILFSLLLANASSVGGYIGVHPISWLGTAGMAALSCVLYRASGWFPGRPDQIRHARFLAAVFVGILTLEMLNNRFLRYTGTAFSLTWDHRIVLLESFFGFQTAFITTRFLNRFTWILNYAFLTYNSLLLGLIALVAIRSRRGLRQGLSVLLQFLAVGILGGALYAITPVAGPRAAFPDTFPAVTPLPSLPDLLPYTVAPSPRNGMPSLHTAWVVLLFLAASGESLRVRLAYAFLMVGTLLATVGTGEHYLLDLIVVIPLAVGVSLVDSSTFRDPVAWLRGGGLYACTVLWVLAFRFAGAELYLIGRFIPLLSLITVAGPFAIRRMARSPGAATAAASAGN